MARLSAYPHEEGLCLGEGRLPSVWFGRGTPGVPGINTQVEASWGLHGGFLRTVHPPYVAPVTLLIIFASMII